MYAASWRPGHALTIGLAVAVAMCAVLLSSASAAWAQEGALSASISPQFPLSVTVGAQDESAALLIQNNSTGDYADDVLRIDQITLTPSCGAKLGFDDCPAGAEDLGVFVLNGLGVGRVGSGCAGRNFTITLLDPVSGRYVFTPVGGELTLGAPGTVAGTCIIDFTFDVARAPAKDSDPAQILPGPLQTDQYATVSVTVITPGSTLGRTGRGFTTTETTVLPATP